MHEHVAIGLLVWILVTCASLTLIGLTCLFIRWILSDD